MTPEKFKRKLTAILSADVKGYSRLMGEDEEGTIRTLNAYMGVINGFIQQHRGRVVATGGDSVLAEFTSVVDAVRCAVGIQEELKDRNRELPEEKRMEFRIGVNLGDVVEEGDNILGDGVNIAARVQSLAEAGGISISGTAYDHVKNKVTLRYEYVGEQAVKNIAEPVRVYHIRTETGAPVPHVGAEQKVKTKQWRRMALSFGLVLIVVAAAVAVWRIYLHPTPSVEVASEGKMAFPLPDKPSIAVLPFANISGDPAKDYLSDGLAEEIINAFSKISNIFVIARNSTFTYKGKSVKVQRVAEEMGVRYVLEGSVQWSGDRVRITAQLIDALKGHHLFSERYDRDLTDIFALQDEITMKVLTAMRVKLTAGEQARGSEKGTKNLDAYLKLLQAQEHMQVFNKDEAALSRQFVEESLSLDPQYAAAYAVLANVNILEVFVGASKSPGESLDRAEELAKKALVLNDSLFYAHYALSLTYLFKRQFEKALSQAEQTVSHGPNSALAFFMLGSALLHLERFEEAIPHFKKSLRLSPIPFSQCLGNLAGTYRFLGWYDEAIATFKKMTQLFPDNLIGHLGLAATFVLAGREEEAHAEAAEVMRIDPRFSLERYAKTLPYRQALVDQLVAAWRKAGLK